jgi:hypothetical protein
MGRLVTMRSCADDHRCVDGCGLSVVTALLATARMTLPSHTRLIGFPTPSEN